MKNERLKTALKHANVGVAFGVGMALRLAIFYYGGNWIDGKLGTKPWFAFAGILLAIGLSFHHLLTEMISTNTRGSDDETTRKEEK
ncbi:MAG TPA: AtpZ/AtpI family protein [Clostridia bacterium]|nr:AtpZ/AtpI family protein [Clostridia bacterium]